MKPIFSNQYNIVDHKLNELVIRWDKYQNDIDSQTLLNQIKYTLAKDYYLMAKEWLNRFKDADWYREDLI